MRLTRGILVIAVCLLACSCSGDSENDHTTATTFVTPPTRQNLRRVERAQTTTPNEKELFADVTSEAARKNGIDPTKPLIALDLPMAKHLRKGEPLVLEFAIKNAKLKGDGGDYRVRYIVDDDEPQWVDRAETITLEGWTEGKHNIRFELIGPDGWPIGNGGHNVIDRQIFVDQ